MIAETKTHAYRLHAKYRAKERFDVDYTRAMERALVADIREGRSIKLAIATNSRSWHAVVLDGKPAIALYSRSRKTIVTFLRPEHQASGKTMEEWLKELPEPNLEPRKPGWCPAEWEELL